MQRTLFRGIRNLVLPPTLLQRLNEIEFPLTCFDEIEKFPQIIKNIILANTHEINQWEEADVEKAKQFVALQETIHEIKKFIAENIAKNKRPSNYQLLINYNFVGSIPREYKDAFDLDHSSPIMTFPVTLNSVSNNNVDFSGLLQWWDSNPNYRFCHPHTLTLLTGIELNIPLREVINHFIQTIEDQYIAKLENEIKDVEAIFTEIMQAIAKGVHKPLKDSDRLDPLTNEPMRYPVVLDGDYCIDIFSLIQSWDQYGLFNHPQTEKRIQTIQLLQFPNVKEEGLEVLLSPAQWTPGLFTRARHNFGMLPNPALLAAAAAAALPARYGSPSIDKNLPAIPTIKVSEEQNHNSPTPPNSPGSPDEDEKSDEQKKRDLEATAAALQSLLKNVLKASDPEIPSVKNDEDSHTPRFK